MSANPIVTARHDDIDGEAVDVEVPRSAIPYLEGFYEVDADGNRVEHVDAEAAAELKGADLDEALDARGLPKSGSADEKRARVAEHDADQDPTPGS